MAKKIPVSAPQAPLATPFAGLQLDGLPAGPAENPEPGPAAEIERLPSGKLGRIFIRKEKSGRSGKTVTVIAGFIDTITDIQLDRLAGSARKALGCGGTLAGREIELQGDVQSRARIHFSSLGFKVQGGD